LVGLDIDNILIELNANEPPIGDGSVMPFVNKLLEAGIEEQNEPKEYVVIEESITYSDEQRGIEFAALPTDGNFRRIFDINTYESASKIFRGGFKG